MCYDGCNLNVFNHAAVDEKISFKQNVALLIITFMDTQRQKLQNVNLRNVRWLAITIKKKNSYFCFMIDGGNLQRVLYSKITNNLGFCDALICNLKTLLCASQNFCTYTFARSSSSKLKPKQKKC